MHILLLFCILKYTEFRAEMGMNTLFSILISFHIISERLQAIRLAHQHIAMVLCRHDRLQDFFFSEEYRRTITRTRPMPFQVQHSLINDLALFPTTEQKKQLRARLPNQDPIQLQNANIISPGSSFPVLRQFSVSIPREKLTVILGGTGSGKSQLLKVN